MVWRNEDDAARVQKAPDNHLSIAPVRGICEYLGRKSSGSELPWQVRHGREKSKSVFLYSHGNFAPRTLSNFLNRERVRERSESEAGAGTKPAIRPTPEAAGLRRSGQTKGAARLDRDGNGAV